MAEGINNNAKLLTAMKIAGESATPSSHFALGTGTTDLSRSSDTLNTEVGRKVFSDSDSENNVAFSRTEINPGDTTLHSTFYETGLFNSSSGGSLIVAETHGALVTASTKTTRITKFVSVNPSANTSRAMATKYFVDAICGWLAGDSSPATGSHMAWGLLTYLDKNDSLGAGGTAIAKSADAATAALDTVNLVEGTACVKMGKTGTSTTSFYYERTISPAVDASSATHFRIYVRIDNSADRDKLAASSAVTFRIGNDSGNYFSYSVDRANLIVGWQQIEIPIADMSETGAVTESSMDYMRITWSVTNSSDTITSGNLLMDYWAFWWKLAYSDTTLHSELTRAALSPAVTRNAEIVNFQAELDRSSANTYQIDYVALFDAASNGNPSFILELQPIQKNSLVEVSQDSKITVNIKDF